MSQESNASKPCLVETRQGLSVLYENRFLYSKYNPAASIERLVASLELKKDTLVLCFSPILGYGLNELAEKLPVGCFLLAIEIDEKLMELYGQEPFPAGLGFLGPSRQEDIYSLLTRKNQVADNGVRIPHPGTFRQCVRVDFSAAPALRQDEYQRVQQRAELAVANFWKNRLTLIKMGRLYHRNILRNLALVPHSYEIPAGKIGLPLLVLGAGPSADKTIAQLALLPEAQRKKIVVVAVDAAVPALAARRVRPDFVLALECQHAIQQAYSQTCGAKLFVLADITSRPSILHLDTSHSDASGAGPWGKNCSGGNTAFFSTEFAGTRFLERLQQQRFVQQVLPPLGSVGIAAMELALLLRESQSVPVYVSGLDFSFLLERSHCKESFQIANNFLRSNRITTLGSYQCLANPTTERMQGKAGAVHSDQILCYYRQIFRDRFKAAQNAYDLGETGLDLGLERTDLSRMLAALQSTDGKAGREDAPCQKRADREQNLAGRVREFYLAEEAMLQELREGLSTGNIKQERILEILEEADYLYLHFPDGYRPSLDVSFLKRVRSEIDFFLKDIAIGKRLLEDR